MDLFHAECELAQSLPPDEGCTGGGVGHGSRSIFRRSPRLVRVKSENAVDFRRAAQIR